MSRHTGTNASAGFIEKSDEASESGEMDRDRYDPI